MSLSATKREYAPPPILLIRPKPKEASKGESVKLDLKYNPNDPNSTMYSMKVNFFKQGTPVEWVKFCKTLTHVLKGQGIKENPTAKYTMAQTLLKGEALKSFEVKHKMLMEQSKTNEGFLECMKAVALQVFPKQILAKQKQYMHCYMHKQHEMKVHELVATLNKMMEDLAYFPPFKENQMQLMDKVLDIFKVMMLKEWRSQMIFQGIKNTKLDSLNDVIEFCKCMEVLEDLFTAKNKVAEQKTGHNVKASLMGSLQRDTLATWSA